MTDILTAGDKVLVAHRRLYEGDEVRFFIGEVVAYDAGVLKTAGKTYLRDFDTGTFVPKEDTRTKLFALTSGSILVYELPRGTDLADVTFQSQYGRTFLTDGNGLSMNLSEHSAVAQRV